MEKRQDGRMRKEKECGLGKTGGQKAAAAAAEMLRWEGYGCARMWACLHAAVPSQDGDGTGVG